MRNSVTTGSARSNLTEGNSTNGNHAKTTNCLTPDCSQSRQIVALARSRALSPRPRSQLCPASFDEASGNALVHADFDNSWRLVCAGFDPETADMDARHCLGDFGSVDGRRVVLPVVS